MATADLKTTTDLARVPLMDIYSRKGAEVVFTGLNGYEHQKKRAAEFLEVGKTYTVERTEVGQSSSVVKLQGIDTTFNTVHFVCAEKYQQFLSPPQDPFGGAAGAQAVKTSRIEALRAGIAEMQSELDELEKDETPSPI